MTIPAGATFVELSVPVIDDNLVEPDEDVVILLTGTVGTTSSMTLPPCAITYRSLRTCQLS